MRAMQRRAMRMDGRNPYGSEGGYVVSRRARGDRLMMDDMRRYNRGEYEYDLAEMTNKIKKLDTIHICQEIMKLAKYMLV